MSLSTDAPMLAEPRALQSQAEQYFVSRPHGSYSTQEVSEIVDLYFEVCPSVGLDPLLAISQMALDRPPYLVLVAAASGYAEQIARLGNEILATAAGVMGHGTPFPPERFAGAHPGASRSAECRPD